LENQAYLEDIVRRALTVPGGSDIDISDVFGFSESRGRGFGVQGGGRWDDDSCDKNLAGGPEELSGESRDYSSDGGRARYWRDYGDSATIRVPASIEGEGDSKLRVLRADLCFCNRKNLVYLLSEADESVNRIRRGLSIYDGECRDSQGVDWSVFPPAKLVEYQSGVFDRISGMLEEQNKTYALYLHSIETFQQYLAGGREAGRTRTELLGLAFSTANLFLSLEQYKGMELSKNRRKVKQLKRSLCQSSRKIRNGSCNYFSRHPSLDEVERLFIRSYTQVDAMRSLVSTLSDAGRSVAEHYFLPGAGAKGLYSVLQSYSDLVSDSVRAMRDVVSGKKSYEDVFNIRQ